MLVRALLQTSLVLWLVQNTIQGGVRPQTGALGRMAPSRGAGILGARGYGVGKSGNTGGAAFRPTGIRGPLKQGYGTLGYGAANLGTGLGASLGANGLGTGTGYGLGNGLGAALGYQGGKLGGRGYTSNGFGAQQGYAAGGYPGAGRADMSMFPGVVPRGGQPMSQGERGNGYGRRGVPNGQGAITNGKLPPKCYHLGPEVTNGVRAQIKGYGPGAGMVNGQGAIRNGGILPSGQGTNPSKSGYGLGAAGYLGAGLADGYGAGLGAGGYPQGVRGGKQNGYSNGYGTDIYGTADGYGAGPAFPAVLADNIGLNGIAGLGAGGLGGPGLVVGTGMGTDAKSRKYAAGGVLGAAGSLPYGGQPVVSAGLGPQGKTGSYGGTTYEAGTGGALEPLSVGGGVGQFPYNAPIIAGGINGDAGFPYGAEQLSLGADATQKSAKYGAGYGAALSTGGHAPYTGQKDGSKSGLSGIYGNGYKG
ncbi:fibroin heavy chain isoform X5 [Myxocyprinus asiaticus]|uniref:fibroin heavy chain isoform X5 n=1 Tax=Myxocyprinus asiaticus TaxID=70543 RepID=UPI0022216167|nr:fibroin heavy chain isoform X5 [Myxocyprinus asiaticus]